MKKAHAAASTGQQGMWGEELDAASGPQRRGAGAGADIPGSAAGSDIQTRRVDLGSGRGDGRRSGRGVGRRGWEPRMWLLRG